MADVRSLLRNERAQRRINHPQATYTATGTLECTVCQIPLKSDLEVWNKHLKSTQHAMRQERLRLSRSRPTESTHASGASNGSRKRKADDGDDDARKKTRPAIEVPGGFFDDMIESNNVNVRAPAIEDIAEVPDAQPTDHKLISTILPSHLISHPTSTPQPAIDEDEWAAFERDVATPPPDPSLPSALTTEATISAAPLTAAELAAQSRKQLNHQGKETREAEVEGEKEDAARALEEEFDEMEGLEERVTRLRRMREELRAKRTMAADEKVESRANDTEAAEGMEEENEDEESDDENELYGWGALGR